MQRYEFFFIAAHFFSHSNKNSLEVWFQVGIVVEFVNNGDRLIRGVNYMEDVEVFFRDEFIS